MALNYSLATSYIGSAFLDGFNFWDSAATDYPGGPDPSHGFVQYQNRAAAEANNLTWIDPVTGSIRLSVDDVNMYDPAGPGRPSVRLESIQSYTHGLIIGDFNHIPSVECGVWPAFWMYGPSWPNDGEIDIVEGGSNTTRNQYGAHTSSGCTIPPEGQALDSYILNNNLNCDGGCSFAPPAGDTSSYGLPFNAVDGGVFAMEWTSDFIKLWHFHRSVIPADIGMDTPDPTGWGTPQAIFGGSTCAPDTYFQNMTIVINIDMCGDWPGVAWGQDDSCDSSTGYATCNDFIANEPGLLTPAYWDVNYIKVYKPADLTSSSSTSISPSSSVSATPSSSTNSSDSSSMMTSTTSSDESTSTTTTTVLTTLTITVTRDSSTTAITPAASTAAQNPATIGDSAYMGCLGSNSTFSAWSLGGTDGQMTVEKCVSTYCAGHRFAGAFNTTCYCAGDLGGDTEEAAPEACNMPCPGNRTESCGGTTDSVRTGFAVPRRSLFARDAPAGILLTIYGVVAADIPQQAPAMGSSLAANSSTSTSPTSTTIVTTVVYTTVCPTNAAMLVTSTYCTTIAVNPCGCSTTAAVSVPMMTFTRTCNACGANGESTVTLVVPESISTGVSYVEVTATVIPMNTTAPRVVATAGAGRFDSAPSLAAMVVAAIFGLGMMV